MFKKEGNLKKVIWKMKGSTKKYLRSLAHHLKPVVIVGKNGINSQLIASTEVALNDHELIKVRFGEFKEEKKRNIRGNRSIHKKRDGRHHRKHRHLLPPASRTGKKKN
jgi:putative YhbY family RNA-binding protein